MEDRELAALLCGIICAFAHHLIAMNTMTLILICGACLRQPVLKVPLFYENVVPYMSPRIHRRYFRMYEETLHHLINFLRPTLFHNYMYARISVQKKIAMTCAYLGSTSPTLQLAHLFGVAEEPFLRVTEEVMDALVARINELIYWPRPNELAHYAAEYNVIGRFFPNVIGAIDDIHLEIKLTEEKARHRSYFCWKQYFSIHLQAVATYDLRFLDIFVGWPGRSHDSRVFANNPLYQTLPDRLRRNVARLSETYHIVGDSAFPNKPQILTPFKRLQQQDLNAVERKYNRNLASKRNNVERAFALLLQRFPRVTRLNQRYLRKKIKIVMCACILHNLCILENDNVAFFLQRAQQHVMPQLNQQYRPLGTPISTVMGTLKRLQLANIIYVN